MGQFTDIQSADGFVYYSRKQSSDQVWKISPQGGEESLVMSRTGLDCWCQLTLAPHGIYYIANTNSGNRTLFHYDFKSRERSPVAALTFASARSHCSKP